jgi:PAS domain S-box-containing protein
MFELLYGAKKADILGKTDYDFVDRETADFFRANDRHAMEADAPKVNEEWLSFAVGGYRALFETIKTPMRAGDGRLIGVLGVARDISRLHAAQERLREQEEIYRAIVSQAGDGIVLIDTETLGFREFNDAAAEMLGYNREEFARLSLPDLQGKLSPDEVSRAIRDLLEVDGADFEIQHRHKDGSLRDMLTSNRPVTLRGQRYVAAIWRDITEQKQTEAELTTYRESLVALVAQRTEALETANRRLQVSDRRLNAMFEMSQRSGELQERELLQMGIDEAVRLTDSEIGYLHFVDEDAQTIELVTWSHGTLKYCQATYDNHYPIAAAGIWADTVRLHRPVVHNDYQHMRGPHGYPACHAHLVRHLGVPLIEQGKVRMLLGVGNKATDYDATDIRELELIGNDLWRIIMRRRTEIALAEAKDAAEAANRAKSVFLANMSHEIRTPMNAILGLTHLLQRGAQDPRQRDQLDKVSSAAQHLLALINNILDISKIEAGKLNLEHTDINLDRLFAGIFDLLCDKARDKGLEIVQDIDPALPLRLRGDATRLGQVLLNLASNAVKFTDAGTVVLRALPAETAACVRFEVLDTGIGLSEAQIRRLFQPFEQADNSTTRRYGGTGLGLAISHRLVELMGGRTGVESEPGKGSRFWFEVPLPAASAQPEPPAPRAELTGRRVLVVDDLEPVRAGLTRQLTSQGLTVECVDNAEAAMSRITEADAAGAAYWSVFLDQHLPGVDGLAIARQIAATPLARPPLLTLLGDAEAGLRGLDLHASGIKAILRKPVGRAGLHVALAELCDTPPSLPPVAASPAASALQALSAYRDARLLLAEDDPINQEVAVQLLHDAGLAVDVAENGEKALELARAGRYDLVLMDVQMPVMDGLAATGAIHALPGLEKLPVLAMTANVFADDRQSCLAAGMCDHVAKPVDPEQLYAALLRWLPEQARRAPVQAPAATPVAADVALLARLRAIEGLDADAGLKVLRNRLPTYMRLLEQFARDHAGDVARARACLASGDPDEARRLVHSIKGAAATLGAESVRAAALEMEMAIRAGQPETTLAPLAAALEAAQAQLSQALAGLPRPASAMAAAAEVDWPKVRQALSELVGLLEEDDIRASTYYRERETLIAPVLGGRARGIARLIGQFSLDTALVEIREAIRDLPELTR